MNFVFFRKPLPASEVDHAFRVAADNPLAAEHALLAALIEEGERVYAGRTARDEAVEWGNDGFAVANLTASKLLDRLDAAGQDRLVVALIQRLTPLDQAAAGIVARSEVNHWSYLPRGFVEVWRPRMLLYSTLKRLLRRNAPPLAIGSWATVARWCASAVDPNPYWVPIKPLLDVAEGLAQTPAGLDGELAAALTELGQMLRTTQHPYLETRRWLERVETLTGQTLPMQPGEAWSDAALVWLTELPPERRSAWVTLLSHCRNATGSRPNAAWRKEAVRLLGSRVPFTEVRDRALTWFPLVNRPRTDLNPETLRYLGADGISNLHQDLLRGLVWLCAQSGEDPDLARALAGLAIGAYRKGSGWSDVRSSRVGNACVYILGAMPGRAALGHLALMRVKVKYGTAQREIAKALEVAAARGSLPPDEIEEMAVPDYGMSAVGRLVREFGDSAFAAELTVTGTHTTEMLWRNLQTGKTQRAVPATIRSAHPEELREFKAAAKDLQAMLPAQAQRLDALFLQRRRWPLPTWRERYLDHPLVGTLARRLIWKFHRGDEETPFAAGLWLDGALRDRRGRALTLDDATDTVTLWHPLDVRGETAEITAWRGWLEEHEIRQPFKQAHREVYLLTPAEERTETYSNRFAAHLLNQHQFHALCAQRGWRNTLRLPYGDPDYPPARRGLPPWRLSAEFWIEGAAGPDDNNAGTIAYPYVSTDQARFYLTGENGRPAADDVPLPLTEVPPLVFSEIMRDVDLFVGVASVGNDPAWSDGGTTGRFRDYWTEYSFGDLSATAHTRRDALGRLVPRLKIAARCSFTERFLVVRGELRTYKIHLGSGNILMSPDDRYLCIVPGSGAAADAAAGPKVFLPFEGDRTLSVILSKAFLLAADDRITDPTITRQIRA